MADVAPRQVSEENEIPMDVRNISYGSGRKLTPEERKERRRKRREAKIARGESVGDSDDSDDDLDDEEGAEEIQEGLTEMNVPKLNLGPQLLETDIDAEEDLICPRKVRFGEQMAAPPGQGQAGSVLSTPRSVTTDELEARLEDLRRQTDRILYVLDCMDSRLGGPGLVRGLEAPKLPPGASGMLSGPAGEGMLGPLSPGSSFRSQAQDSIGPEIAAHDHSYPGHKIPGSAFSLPSGSNGRNFGAYPGSYVSGPSAYSPASSTPYPSGSYVRPIGFVGFSGQKSRWGPLGKGSGLGVLAAPGAPSPKLSEVQYIEQQTQCLLRDLEALQSIVIPPSAAGSAFNLEPRGPQMGQRSSLRRTQSLRAPRSSRGRSYGHSVDPAGPANNALEYLTSLIQIRRSVVGVTDRLRPMDHLLARGRR